MGTSRSRRQARRAWLYLEPLESRQLLATGFPTAVEQLFLEELNAIRANPAAYGKEIGVNLSNVPPSPPLAFNPELEQAAQQHSQQMNAADYFGHDTPTGLDPGGQISQAGFAWTSWGQSLAAGTSVRTAASALKALITDAGVPDLTHRSQLLALTPIFQDQNQVGIGIVQNGSGPLANYYTIDTASSADSEPLLTGVVFRDANHNGQYDLGEGLGGVTISVAGVGSTTTFSSGGYTLAVPPGTYTVTASGGGLPAPISHTVTVGQSNVEVQFIYQPNPAADWRYAQKLYQTVLGRTGSAVEIGASVAYLEGGAGRWGLAWAIEHSAEARARLVKSWYVTYLGRPAAASEVSYWVSVLLQGVSEEAVLTALLTSPEFYQHAAALVASGSGDQRYIEALYMLLLHRQPSAVEVNASVAYLELYGQAAVVNAFVSSPEYLADMVTRYYEQLLHWRSAPSAAIITAWLSSGLDLTTIRIVLEMSDAFYSSA